MPKKARPPEEMIRRDGRNVLRVPGLAEFVLRPDDYPKTKQELKNLPTPKYSDGEHPGVKSHKPGQTKHLSAAVNTKEGGKLSPIFVEAMQGFPMNYTNKSNHRATCDLIPQLMTYEDLPIYLPYAVDFEVVQDRKERLQALGNSVCPQVVASVFDDFLSDYLQASQD